MPVTVYYLGNPDTGLIVVGYLGSLLMAGSFLAVGSFFSALSKNQVVSFILSVVACAILVYAGMPTTIHYLSGLLPAGALAMVERISFLTRFESLQKGVLEFKDMAYFVIVIMGWIWASTIVLNEKKAS
jgi:ABC-2 type transport system permease protein